MFAENQLILILFFSIFLYCFLLQKAINRTIMSGTEKKKRKESDNIYGTARFYKGCF